jgi:hypothetical protein
MDRQMKLLILLILIIAFLVANYFNDFFLWRAILENKNILSFSLFCVIVWEVFRTAVGR